MDLWIHGLLQGLINRDLRDFEVDNALRQDRRRSFELYFLLHRITPSNTCPRASPLRPVLESNTYRFEDIKISSYGITSISIGNHVHGQYRFMHKPNFGATTDRPFYHSNT